MPPQRVWFSSRFGLKAGIDFEHFGLKLGMVIGGTFTKANKLTVFSQLNAPGVYFKIDLVDPAFI